MIRTFGGLLALFLVSVAQAQDEGFWRALFDGAPLRPSEAVAAQEVGRTGRLAAPAPASLSTVAGTPATPETSRDRLRETIAYLTSPALGGRGPMSEGSRLAREHIIVRFREHGLRAGAPDGTFVEAVNSRLTGARIGSNVVAYIEGAGAPRECVYVEAHYDHWGRAGGRLQPGANDNASGVAMMLELAAAVAVLKPERTVVFLAADYEEGALSPMLGGLKGARSHARRPFCAADKIKGALVMDMMGGKFIEGLDGRLFLLGSESSAQTYALAGRAAAAGVADRFGVYAIEPVGARVPRGDYAAFRDIKVPFICATSGIPAFYHTEQDTIDRIDFDFMERGSLAVLELITAMSSADFNAVYARDPDAVVDWTAEKATAQRLIERVSARHTGTDLRTLAELGDRLRAADRTLEIKDCLTDLTMSLMKMNGALKTWEHLYRKHGP